MMAQAGKQISEAVNLVYLSIYLMVDCSREKPLQQYAMIYPRILSTSSLAVPSSVLRRARLKRVHNAESLMLLSLRKMLR